MESLGGGGRGLLQLSKKYSDRIGWEPQGESIVAVVTGKDVAKLIKAEAKGCKNEVISLDSFYREYPWAQAVVEGEGGIGEVATKNSRLIELEGGGGGMLRGVPKKRR